MKIKFGPKFSPATLLLVGLVGVAPLGCLSESEKDAVPASGNVSEVAESEDDAVPASGDAVPASDNVSEASESEDDAVPASGDVSEDVSAASSAYSLTGFASGDTGGGVVSESDTAHYRKVYNATDLALA